MRGHFLRAVAGSGALWTPASIATALWFDAADSSTITTAGGAVSQWNDKSGNARHATQASSGLRPVHSVTGFNGLPGVTFDGIDDILPHGLASGGPFSLIAVYRVNALQGGYRSLFTAGPNSATGCQILMRTGSGFVGTYAGADRNSSTAYANGQTLMVIIEDDNTSSSKSVWINGANGLTFSANPEGQTFAALGGGELAQSPAATIAECLAVSGVPSTTNRQLIEGYLAHRWGIAASLPGAHPYTSAAPTL